MKLAADPKVKHDANQLQLPFGGRDNAAYILAMTGKPKSPKPTDAERHQRFVAMAYEVEAAEEVAAFDRAFDRVAKPPEKPEAPDD